MRYNYHSEVSTYIVMEEYWEGPPYQDRIHAGEVLAKRLRDLDPQDPLVLAIPNGGVPVGAPIARALNCPLHLIVVRKLQIPENPEAGFGSVASDGTMLLNHTLVESLGISEKTIQRQKGLAMKSIRERISRYGKMAQFPELFNRTVVLVDDGLASGFTMEAAIHVVKKHSPGGVVVAVPTSSMTAFRRISPLVDTLLCPDVSRLRIFAVANAYKEWRDLDDEEIIAILRESE